MLLGAPGALALVVLCAAVYLPGLAQVPPVDRDESRFAQASRQMFEAAAWPADAPVRLARPMFYTGGWVIPKHQERDRLNKPPLVYWLQAASAWVFTGGRPERDAMWMYRFPSAACAVGAVLIIWWLGRRVFDRRVALTAAAMLAVSPIVVWDAHQARADQLLLLCTTAAMAALWCVWRRVARGPVGASVGWAAPLALWVATGAGLLAKGPVTLMVVALSVVSLAVVTRRWVLLRAVRPGLGLVVMLAMTAPWLWAVAQHVGGVGVYAQTVFDEFFARGLRGSREGHFAPPGTHTVLLAVLFWPGSLFTLAAVVRAVGRARGGAAWSGAWRGRDAELFLLAWLAPSWLVFELSLAKLPHYTLPLYPAVALLSARMLLELGGRWPDFGQRVGAAVWLVIGATLTIGTLAAVVWFNREAPAFPAVVSVIGLLAAAGGLLGAACFVFKRWLPIRATLLAGVAWVVTVAVGLTWTLPGWTDVWITPRVAAIVGPAPLAAVGGEGGFAEDSLIFATRGRAERLLAEPRELRAFAGRWQAVGERAFAVVPASVDRSGWPAHEERGLVRGHNYANGSAVDVVIIEFAAPASR